MREAMRIICVDPSPQENARLARNLRRVSPGSSVSCFRSACDALSQAEAEGCDVLMTETDLRSPYVDGFLLAEQIAAINPLVNVIFVTERADNAGARLALDMRASGYMQKPLDCQRLELEFQNLRHTAE